MMSTRARRLALAAAAAGALYLLQRRRAQLRRGADKARDGAGSAGSAGAERKPRGPDPMLQIFWRLWPFFKSGKELREDPDARAGGVELVAIFLVSVLRTWHQNRMVYVKRDLMTATYHRDQSMFMGIIRETVVLSVLSSAIFAVHRYLKERLTLVWREKITRQLHRRYFHNMNYYKISHMNKQAISDVEERITRDPRRFCKGLADEMEKLSAALTSGVWFTYKLTTISSLPYAVSPLVYFYVAFRLSFSLAPNWSKRWRGMLDRRGVYQKAQTRLLTHSEAICAYQGNAQERAIIDAKWQDFLDYCLKFVRDASLFQFATSALFEYGGHSFAEALIVGKYIAPTSAVKQALLRATTAKEKVQANAALFGEIRFLTEYFIRAMSAQGTVIAVLRQLQNMAGPAKRLTELYDTLDRFDTARQVSTTFKNDMQRIEFANVQIFTPTGHRLVKDLNFHIEIGTSMLLTGCNGSGKSSLFRCLGSLWEVPEGGTITKPGGGLPGLNKSVFYLPQKPYNVLGTLREQLTYPESADTARSISRAELLQLLDEVDLGYLIDRGAGVDDETEVNWETVLSLGEKQRLAMARLFWHSSKNAAGFAILDECTSGVSASLERKLYRRCEERGITCITISHRPVLEQYHDVVLNILADGQGSWEWRETARGRLKSSSKASAASGTGTAAAAAAAPTQQQEQALLASSAAAVGGYSAAYLGDKGADQALLERTRLKERSAAYVAAAQALKERTKELAGERGLPKVPTRKRFLDVLAKFMPRGASLSDPETWRVLLLAALVVGKTLLADAIARYDGYILGTVMQDDWGVFVRAVASGAFFRTFLSVFDAQMMLHKWYLNLEWRKRLTSYLMDKWFHLNTFYDVKNHDDRIADPDERLTEQVETLSISLTELWTSLLKPAFDIAFNSVMLYRTLGSRGVTYTTGYMVGGLLVMRFVVPNFRKIRREEMDLESRFRFVHTRLVEHTESIAFFGGDEVEHQIAEGRFGKLSEHSLKVQAQTARFNLFNNFTLKQTPDLVAFALRMFYAEGFFSDEQVAKGDGSDISQQGEYIQQTVMRSFKSFGDAFDLQETVGQFFGVLENVSDLMYVLEDVANKQQRQRFAVEQHTAAEGGGGMVVPSRDGSIEFDGVDIVAPGAICCASNLSFKVAPGHSLVVTGPNSAGKSSLFRTLGGLWPIPKGTIRRPCNERDIVTPKQVFLVPQKPYSVTGSLADQITYPEMIAQADFSPEHDRALRDLLKLVKVEYLVDREGGWHAVAKWEDTLSLGEQQRIGCARLFYHNPTFAIIDEATSAVSVDVEQRLYKVAHDRGITLITISQRLALEEFHDHELMLGDANGADGWAMRTIPRSK